MLVALAFSGCAGKPAEEAAIESPGASTSGPRLHGWVQDEATLPIEGANVTVSGANASVLTDAVGYYELVDLPANEALVVIVQKDGYLPQSVGTMLSLGNTTRLNFTLATVPADEGYTDVLDFTGRISCQLVVTVTEENERFECGAGIDPQNNPIWEFPVGPRTAGIVIEITWEAGTSLAEDLNLTVETSGFGDQDAVLTMVEGPNVLRTQVNAMQAAKYYSQGGLVRATLGAATNVDDEEVGVGAALAFQQSFDVFATIFYVDPPSPEYSYFDSG